MTEFKLDLSDERLWNGDRQVRISNKAFQLLKFFVCNPNRLLTKEAILEEVWRGVYVSEGLVKEYVHDLRRALGDNPRQPCYIETAHGRGYRFLGGVAEHTGAIATAGPPKPGKKPPSLAVLPFKNLTGEDRWSRLCHGLRDDLIIDIARYPDLIVISSDTPTIQPLHGPDGGENEHELTTDYALEGSIQSSADKVRINVKLIENLSGAHVWTDRYEREMGEYFAVQSDIVGHVASAVGGFSGQIPHAERLRLGRTPPDDLQAYELYLLGHELEARFEKQSTLRAFKLMQRAVDLDPSYARAWLVQGWTCWQILLEKWDDDVPRYSRLRRESFVRAATLDPLDPFAMMELAEVRAADDDFAGARDALERALDLGANQADLLISISNPIALVMGDPVRAERTLEKGLKLINTVGDWQRLSMARVAYFTGDFERALVDARRGPKNLLTRLVEILSLAQLGLKGELDDRKSEFEAMHPNFDAQEFLMSYPITAVDAKQLFLKGTEKAGIG